jgi:hypothetical protein
VFDIGTLSGVTFDGPLNLTAGSEVNLVNGTTVVGSSGSGPGTINDTGGTVYFVNTQTVNTQTVSNETINLGGSSSLDEKADVGDQVLTLASSVTVDVQGDAGINGDIVNEGAIDQTGSGYLYIQESNEGSTTFTNSGTIDVENGGNVTIGQTTFTTTASSVIEIGANSSVTLDPTNAWSNLGKITLASGASLTLAGAMPVSAASLGSITNSGGTIYLAQIWDNFGQTLNGSSLGLVLDGGMITGGTVSGLSITGGILSGVTFDGTLNLAAPSATVHLANGTKVVGSSGSGPGTINVTGDAASLYFDNTQTVRNETINLFSSTDFLYELDTAGAGNQVLTLASRVTIDVQGYAYIDSTGYSGDGIVNDGAIDATGSAGNLVIDPKVFTNSGTIDVSNGDSVIIEPTTFTTTASSVIEIGANSSVTIDPTNAWSNLGKITLAGGASLTSSSITNHGVLERTGGTGRSVITSKVTNAGTIEVSSGTLELKGAVTGKGTDTIANASTLEFSAGLSTAATLGDQDIGFSTGGGTLHLLKPTSFYGEISDFAAGDTVELLGSWAFSGISQAGDVTTLTLGSGSTTHGFEFAGDYAQSNFSIAPGTTTTIKYA